MDSSKLIRTLIVIASTVLVTFLILRFFKKLLKRSEEAVGPKIHIKFLYNVARLFVILLAIATVGSQFDGFSSTINTILASSGIIALGISLAAQESLSNIIDGLFISMFKPFNIGDRVSLPEKDNLTGFVTEMNLRHTVITTYQNSSYIIPNAVMSGAIIDNSSFHADHYAYPIDVSVSYDSDLDLAIRLMHEAVTTHPAFLDLRTDKEKADGKPDAVVLVRNFGSSGIDLRCQMITRTVNESFVACSEVRIKLKKLFDENGVTIPFNTIHIDNPPAPPEK